MTELTVELYGSVIGRILGTGGVAFDFEVDRDALDRYGIGSTVLSQAVPLERVPRKRNARARRNFFAELLPEGDALDDLRLAAGLRSTEDVVGLLARFGRDVAGALQIWDPTEPGEPRTPRAAPLTVDEVGQLLLDHRRSPLGNRAGDQAGRGKSSLPGVQDKIVLALIDEQWNQALDGFPSTHILKVEPKDQTTIQDEEYGARIARHLKLSTHATVLQDFAGVTALIIERYDRTADSGRIHQEDMNQALGSSGREKYQRYSRGKTTLAAVAKLVRQSGDQDSLDRLLRLNVLSVAAGNLDFHAKNISVTHREDGSFVLAPAYDIVPTAHRTDLDGEMSFAVNGEYVHSTVTISDLEFEARAWGITSPGAKIRETLEQIRVFAHNETPAARSHPELVGDILRFTGNLLDGKAAGRDV